MKYQRSENRFAKEIHLLATHSRVSTMHHPSIHDHHLDLNDHFYYWVGKTYHWWL